MFKNNIIKFQYPKGCYETLQEVLPIPAKLNIPNWYKKLKHNAEFKTIKGCMPFLDSLTAGYILRMNQDLYIKHNWYNEEVKERDSSFRYSMGEAVDVLNAYNLNLNTNARPEIHGKNQLGEECPYHKKNKNLPFYKILNPFTIRTAPGYSCLFVSPLNNADDRFEIISGIVDTDSYNNTINFPIIINGDKYPELESVIKRGTPYVQVIPFKRESWKMHIVEEEKNTLIRGLNAAKLLVHTYKTLNWFKKKWS